MKSYEPKVAQKIREEQHDNDEDQDTEEEI
jgi:hypothetical protein